MAEIYARWSLALRGIDVDTDIGRFQVGNRMAEALQLYDLAAVREAIRGYLHALDPQEQLPTRAELLERIRVSCE
jgi:hypothetical protein